MSKRSLEIFVEVCDQRSMSSAAKTLKMSQPAVSSAIASLEKEYDTDLFVRRGRTLELNAQGKRLRQYADVILEQYDRAWSSIHEEEQADQYVLGISTGASETILPSLIRKLPDELSLSFVCDETDKVMEMLKDHRCDLCIADQNADEEGLTYLPLYKETFVFAASGSYTEETSIGLSALLNHHLLLEKKGSPGRKAAEAAIARKSAELHPYVESSSVFSLIRLAESGAGIAVLPERLIEKSLKKKRLHMIKIKGADMKRQYYLIHRSDMHMSESFRELLGKIRENTGKDYR